MAKFADGGISIELKNRLGWTDYEVYPGAVLVVHEMERDNPLFYEDGILYLPERTCRPVHTREKWQCGACRCVIRPGFMPEFNGAGALHFCPNCGARVVS